MNELLQLGPIALVMLALNFLGKGIKSSAAIPDKYIPIILPIVGAVVYPFVGAFQPLPFLSKVPPGQSLTALYAIVGFGCGGLAVWGNQLLRQFGGRGDTDTTNITPPKP